MEVLMLDLRLEMKDPKRRKRLGEFSPFCEDRAANDPKKADTNLRPPWNRFGNHVGSKPLQCQCRNGAADCQ